MSTEENKAVSRRGVELLNARDLDGLGGLFAEDSELHSTTWYSYYASYELISVLWKAIPNLRIAIESQTAEGDTVVNRLVCYGTYEEHFPPPFTLDIPPTGRHVHVSGCSIDRAVDGKIADHVLYIDWINLLFFQMNEIDYAAGDISDSAFRFSLEGVVEGPLAETGQPSKPQPDEPR